MSEKFKWPFPNLPFPRLWKWRSFATIVVVGSISKVWLCYLNSTKVYGKEILLNAVNRRARGTAMVTVSNHYSCIDDPVLSGMLPWKTLFSPAKLRWTPAAHDICFTRHWHGTFFALGRTIPIVRGDGVYQQGMDFTLEQMNNGEWAHLFPEGKVNMDKTWIRLKWGVGRLISECRKAPIVIPFYHVGVDDILPNTKPYIPRIRKKVTILIGEPMNFEAQLQKCKQLGHSAMQMRKMVTDSIQEELGKLKVEAYELHQARRK